MNFRYLKNNLSDFVSILRSSRTATAKDEPLWLSSPKVINEIGLKYVRHKIH